MAGMAMTSRSEHENFQIIIDTREQQPYRFRDVQVVRSALKTGDYSVNGLESVVSVERKSLNDFVNTIIHGRKRFKAELLRMKRIQYRCLVLEANIDDIMEHRYHSRTSPNAVFSILTAISAKYIPIIFCKNRYYGAKYTHSYLWNVYRTVLKKER